MGGFGTLRVTILTEVLAEFKIGGKKCDDMYDIDISVWIWIFVIIFIIFLISRYFNNPFTYPLIKNTIDISGRKKPSYDECIDQWIIDHKSYDINKNYERVLNQWNSNNERILNGVIIGKKYKAEICDNMEHRVMSDEYPIFQFVFIRKQTRYKQINYQKIAYKVDNVEHVSELTLNDMLKIENSLKKIDYQTTRKKYKSKEQRKLMTKELRRKVIERDNYTCQICGKYMPDEVGLQIDHIISINKGGKTIESNLQVLCDKCNYKKGSKK